MTPPRQIVPNTTMLITCRAVGRSFRFVPTEKVVQTLLFVFAYALSNFEIELNEFCWMSNHYHLVLTTRDDKLPAFIQKLNSMASRALNALRAWSGTNFEKAYSIVVETDPDAILEHCAYTLANPCKAHLVFRANQWTGLTSARMKYGETITIERPKFGLWGEKLLHVMRSRGRARRAKRRRTPDSVTLTLVRPPVMRGKTDAEVRAEIERRVKLREDKADDEREELGRRVMGMKRVRAQHWNDTPKKRDDMFGPVPTHAGSKWTVAQAEQRSREFHKQYRDALRRWYAGEEDVVFPYGTYLMRVRFECTCAAPPS